MKIDGYISSLSEETGIQDGTDGRGTTGKLRGISARKWVSVTIPGSLLSNCLLYSVYDVTALPLSF